MTSSADADTNVRERAMVARAVSIVGHPMVLVPAAIALAMRGRVTAAQGIGIFATVVVAILIVGAYLVHGVRTGRLTHVDASKQDERSSFYRVAILAMGGAALALHFGGAPRSAVYGTTCSFALLVVGSVLNRWLRVSLHVAFAVVAAGTVGIGSPALFAVFLAVAVAVGWSRLVLARHTRVEVAVGAALGAVASIALEWARSQ